MSHEVWEEIYDRLARADRGASHDAGLREHAAAGRAHGAPALSERLGDDARHRASRQPRRRRCASTPRQRLQRRQAQGARGHGVARARHRHRPRRSRLPDLVAAPHRHVPAARRPLRPHDHGHAEGPHLPADARRSDRMRGAAARGPRRRARSHRRARRAARRARAADRRRGRRRRGVGRGRAVRARSAAPGRIASSKRASSIDVVDMLARGFATRRGRRAALVHRDSAQPQDPRAARARAWPRSSGGAIPEVADYRVRARARRTLHRHAERGLRDRDRCPATSSSSATRRGASCRSATAWCASPTRKGSRRRCRSGSARRRRAATS